MTWSELEHMAREIGKGAKWQCKGYGWIDVRDSTVENLAAFLDKKIEVRLAPQKKLVAWTAENAPLAPILIRRIRDDDGKPMKKHIWFSGNATGALISEDNEYWSFRALCAECEYTLDLKTWLPCGKWVEEEA